MLGNTLFEGVYNVPHVYLWTRDIVAPVMVVVASVVVGVIVIRFAFVAATLSLRLLLLSQCMLLL